MGVALLPEVGVRTRLAALRAAGRAGLPAPPAAYWRTGVCSVLMEQPGPLEMDGEVVDAVEFDVSLVRQALKVCR
jgi:hypothetical protein